MGQNLFGTSRFGYTLSLSGDGSRMIVGALFGGYARVYEYDGSSWGQLGSDLTNSDSDNGNFGGVTVMSNDGLRVAVAANTWQSNSGFVQIYDYDGSDWVTFGAKIFGKNGAQFGMSKMSENGNRIVIGGPLHNNNQGYAQVYEKEQNGSNWFQLGQDLVGASGDQYGLNVGMSSDGSRIAIGAIKNNGNGSNSGQVQVFEL